MAITSLLGYGAHSLSINRLEKKQELALKDQKEALKAECKATIEASEKVSHEYQNQITSLSSELDDALRVYGKSCLRVSNKAGSRSDGRAEQGKPSEAGNGSDKVISGEAFLRLLAEGERYRLQVIGLQSIFKEQAKK